jgi:hypothetical protein
MSNVFQKAIEDIADRRLSQNPDLLAAMWQLQIRLNRREFDQNWVKALMQTNRDKYDLYDAYGFAVLWSALVKGQIWHAICDIGYECGANDNVSFNNGILSNINSIIGPTGTTARCHAEFSGGLCVNDGHFAWTDPMEFSRHLDSGEHACPGGCRLETVSVRPYQLPLEVGSTNVATTCGHIFAEGGLARWPYSSTKIYLFYAPRLYDEAQERLSRVANDSEAAAQPDAPASA